MNALANVADLFVAKEADKYGYDQARADFIEREVEFRSGQRSWVIDALRNLSGSEEFMIADQLLDGDFVEAGRLLDNAVHRHLADVIDLELTGKGK